MTTEYLREKINYLRSAVQNEAMQIFAQQLVVTAAEQSTGDNGVDTTLAAQADNARAMILGCQRRLTTYSDALAPLTKELEAGQVEGAS